MMKICLYILLVQISLPLFPQGYDADSIFANDPQAIAFFASFNPAGLDNVPGWDKVVTYRDLGWIELTLSIFDSKTAGDAHSCIVFFHGGGWQTRALNQYKQYAWYLSGLGFTTMAVKYRVFDDSSAVTPYDEVQDAKAAIRYIRQHAAVLNIDANRIVAAGMSAGGQLAASTAFIKGVEDPNENFDISSIPDALILQNPVFDLSEEGWLDGHNLLGDDWLTLSPLQHVDSSCRNIPSLVMSGSADKLAPLTGMIAWDSAYHAMNGYDRLFIFDGRGHGFGNYNENKSGPGHRDFIYCLFFMKSFLADIGFYPVDATKSSPSSKSGATLVYPNPSSGHLNISSDNAIDRVIIYSVSGTIEKIVAGNHTSATGLVYLPFGGKGLKLIRIIYSDGSVESRYIISM